jgi:hypothetical protein
VCLFLIQCCNWLRFLWFFIFSLFVISDVKDGSFLFVCVCLFYFILFLINFWVFFFKFCLFLKIILYCTNNIIALNGTVVRYSDYDERTRDRHPMFLEISLLSLQQSVTLELKQDIYKSSQLCAKRHEKLYTIKKCLPLS